MRSLSHKQRTSAANLPQSAEAVYVALDGDEAGQRRARELARDIGPLTHVLQWPEAIQDANEFLKRHHQFDAVIYDLTMYPEALTSSDRRDFIESMFSGIAGCLTPGGMVTMQCCSEFDPTTQDLLTEILSQLFDHLHFEKSLVPSFCENWVFASARAKRLDPLSRQTESRLRDEVGL